MSELPAGSFRLEGTITVPEDRIIAVKHALSEHIELTRAEEGCLFFNVEPSADIRGVFTVSEAFVDQAAFEFHQERAAKSAWANVSSDIPRDYKTWVVV